MEGYYGERKEAASCTTENNKLVILTYSCTAEFVFLSLYLLSLFYVHTYSYVIIVTEDNMSNTLREI